MPADIIAEESTTLPEGAIISVILCYKKTGSCRGVSYTAIVARRGDDTIEMRLGNRVSPHNVPVLLKIAIREIDRWKAAAKNDIHKTPKNFQQFVNTMKAKDMFLSPILSEIEQPEGRPVVMEQSQNDNTDKNKARRAPSNHPKPKHSNKQLPSGLNGKPVKVPRVKGKAKKS